MVQFVTGYPSRSSAIGEILGQSLGEGLGNFVGHYFANKDLEKLIDDKELANKPLSDRLNAMQKTLGKHGKRGQSLLAQRLQMEQVAEQEKAQARAEQERAQGLQQEATERGVLAKILRGEEATAEELAALSPKTQLEILKAKSKPPPGGVSAQPVPPDVQSKIGSVLGSSQGMNADKLALAMDEAGIPRAFSNSYIESRRRQDESAEKSFDRGEKFEDEMLSDYNAYLNTKNVTDQMSILIEKGNLSSPLMVKFLDSLGIPLGVLENPDSEQFDKLSQELMKNISGTYGSRILKVEVDNFLKSIPSLMNSDEGKRRIVEQWNILAEGKRAKYDSYRDVIKENPGKLPRDYKLQTYDGAERRLNELSERFKSLTMGDVRKKVPPGTPLNNDVSIIQKYMKLAGNDPDEAARMAREDGYEF